MPGCGEQAPELGGKAGEGRTMQPGMGIALPGVGAPALEISDWWKYYQARHVMPGLGEGRPHTWTVSK